MSKKILIKIDEELKNKFQKNCKDFGVTMTDVLIGAIKQFNDKSTTKEK